MPKAEPQLGGKVLRAGGVSSCRPDCWMLRSKPHPAKLLLTSCRSRMPGAYRLAGKVPLSPQLLSHSCVRFQGLGSNPAARLC